MSNTVSRMLRVAVVVLAGCDVFQSEGVRAESRLWVDADELAALPTQGPAWERLFRVAQQPAGPVRLADQEDRAHTRVLAKALVAARTGDATRRQEVEAAILSAIGTERGGRTLALGRNLGTLVIAADLVGLSPRGDLRFKSYLSQVLDQVLDGQTLRQTHERRPNNWGTHASATRAAVAVYLRDDEELARVARVFRGWLGDRSAYAGFRYGDLAWQADPNRPVGINPRAAVRSGRSIDGVLPDDQRRCGAFRWPPPQENYVYEALQGAIATAVILSKNGYPDVWEWQDRALLRAYEWLRYEAQFEPEGDDRWQMPLVDFAYGTRYWDGGAVAPGKNIGWTDWTHGGRRNDIVTHAGRRYATHTDRP
jgi:hypothetical protein